MGDMAALVSLTTLIVALGMCALGNYSGLFVLAIFGPSALALYELSK